MFESRPKETLTPEQEKEFHKTAQRNALGGYIGCDGPECWDMIEQISAYNLGHKVQGIR